MHPAASRALFDAAVATLTPRLVEERGWQLITAEYPTLDVIFRGPPRTPLRVRLMCTDWNELPPSIELLNEDGTYPPAIAGGGGQFNLSAHPMTNRYFVCMVGSREYHMHSSHVSDLWENYRNKSGYDLHGIVFQLWRAWSKCL